jgi:hypothetical protein
MNIFAALFKIMLLLRRYQAEKATDVLIHLEEESTRIDGRHCL